MKKIFSMLTALLLMLSVLSPASAAGSAGVTYDGQTLSYTGGSFGEAFQGMLPGGTYEQSITLSNASDADVAFYMDLEVVRTLMAAGKSGAGYTVSLTCDGELLYGNAQGSQQGAFVGGQGTEELEALNDALDGDILVATVPAGKSADLQLSIAPDDTMSNDYQNALGQMTFDFRVEELPEPTVPNPTPPDPIIIKGEDTVVEKTEKNITTRTVTVHEQTAVKTNDSSPVFVIAGILVVAAVVLAITGMAKKKKK